MSTEKLIILNIILFEIKPYYVQTSLNHIFHIICHFKTVYCEVFLNDKFCTLQHFFHSIYFNFLLVVSWCSKKNLRAISKFMVHSVCRKDDKIDNFNLMSKMFVIVSMVFSFSSFFNPIKTM